MTTTYELTFALVRWGTSTLAIASDHVVEATARLTSLKTWASGELGQEKVFSLRGQVIPLVNLETLTSRLCDAPAEGKQQQQVVILRHGSNCLGLTIDQLIGLKRVEADAKVQLRHGPTSDGLFSSVVQLESLSGEAPDLVSVLDVPALFQRSGTWSTTALGRDDPAASSAEATTRAHYALVEVRGHLVLVDSQYIMSTQRLPFVKRMGTLTSQALGIANFRGNIVQISQLTALSGSQAIGAEPLVCVLQMDGAWSAIVVDAVRQTLWVDSVQMQPLDSSGLQPEDGFSAVVYGENGRRMLVLNCAQMLTKSAQFPPEQSPVGNGQRLFSGHDAQGEDSSGGAYVAFLAGGHRAIQLHAIESIVNYPPHLELVTQRNPAFMGSFHWRKQGVALWDLSFLEGGKRTKIDDETRVLIVVHEGKLVGLVCERLLMLLPARQIEVLQMRQESGRTVEVISHRDVTGSLKSYSKFDLGLYGW